MTSSKISSSSRSLGKLVPFVFYGLLVVFLYLYLRTIDFSKLENIRVDWLIMTLAVSLGLAARYFGTLIWFVLLKNLGATELNDKARLVYVYAKAWMGRYIPGTAPWILGKIYFASQHGISKHKLAVSSLLEGGLQILVTMTLASLILIADSRLDVIDQKMKILMGLIVVVGIIATIPAVFNRLITFAYKIMRHKTLEQEHLATSKTILSGASLYVVQAIINGFSLFFMAKAVYPGIELADMLFVIGAGSLASAVSMLVIFAPSGAGVREGVQLVLLSAIMPKELALVVVIITRIWGIITDVIFWGLAGLTRNLTSSKG